MVSNLERRRGKCSRPTPYTQYPLFLGYDVDPLLKKEVFTMEIQVFQKMQWVFGVGGIFCDTKKRPFEPRRRAFLIVFFFFFQAFH